MEFTKEMAERLYIAVTGNAIDCELRRRRYNSEYRYEIKWVFRDTNDKGQVQYWQFIILIPEKRPEEFEVKGCSSNPKYTKNIPLQHSYKERVRQTVSQELHKILEQSEEWRMEQQEAYDEYAKLHGG
jgi:hypothetical protein